MRKVPRGRHQYMQPARKAPTKGTTVPNVSHEQLLDQVQRCLDALSSFIWLTSKPNSTFPNGKEAKRPGEQWLLEKCCDSKLFLEEVVKELDPHEDDLD